MADWTCRELGASEIGGILAACEHAPPTRTLHLRDALAAPAAPGRWWFAAIGAGGVGAFAAVQGTRASLYGDDTDAVQAMARAMLRSQQLHASREAHRHVLFGPAEVLDPFWQIFRDVGRQVVADRNLDLVIGDGEGKGSRRMELRVATAGDLALCVSFLGEHIAEVQGQDPRRMAPAAFERDVDAAIGQGRILVGTEGGRAMFVAEAAPLTADTVMLVRIHVPLPYRSRKVLVGGALFAARSIGPGAAGTVWLFADGEMMQLAATRAGYRSAGRWREIAMLG